uniref:Uncharacterized protein n=1 Tax=Avena sativa TaxID=4498 RepID=A0ACD5XMP7_AVESA
MTTIVSREFPEFTQDGLNYLTWASDVEIVLEDRCIKDALIAGTPTAPSTTIPADNAKALHFLRHHMCETLKNEYMAERSASALWTALNKRFSRLKYTIQPQAEADWIRLRFADFKTVGEYNSRLHRICTQAHPQEERQEVKKGPNSFNPAKQHKAGKRKARPQDCFRCGSKTHFSRQCLAPKHVVDAFKANKKVSEAHLVQVEAPLAPGVAPVQHVAPVVAQDVAQVAAPSAVPTNSAVPMEVEHIVPPPQLDISAASMMIANEEKLNDLEKRAEIDGFFAEST